MTVPKCLRGMQVWQVDVCRCPSYGYSSIQLSLSSCVFPSTYSTLVFSFLTWWQWCSLCNRKHPFDSLQWFDLSMQVKMRDSEKGDGILHLLFASPLETFDKYTVDTKYAIFLEFDLSKLTDHWIRVDSLQQGCCETRFLQDGPKKSNCSFLPLWGKTGMGI